MTADRSWVPTKADLRATALKAFCRTERPDLSRIVQRAWDHRRSLQAPGSVSHIIALIYAAQDAHAGRLPSDDPDDIQDAAARAADFFLGTGEAVFELADLAHLIGATGTPVDLVCDSIRAGLTDEEVRGALATGEWPDQETLTLLISLRSAAP